MLQHFFKFSCVLHLTIGLDFSRGGRREEAEATATIIALPGDRASRLARQKYLARPTNRPCMKIETDRDRDLFQKSDRDRSTLEKARS